MAPLNKSGKLRAKFDQHILNDNLYEAYQLCCTLIFRYSNSGQYDIAIDLAKYAANILLDRGELHSATDLTKKYIDLLVKAGCVNERENVTSITTLISRFSPGDDRNSIVNTLLKASKSSSAPHGSPYLHSCLAKMYESEGNSNNARYHYSFSDDSAECAMFIIRLSATGLPEEPQLFASQMILQYLVTERSIAARRFFEVFISSHPAVPEKSPPFTAPLLNFLYLLLAIITEGNKNEYIELTTAYETSLRRDPSFAVCLEKIGQKYFGMPVQKQQGAGGIMGLLDSLFDSSGDQQPTDGTSTEIHMEASDLD